VLDLAWQTHPRMQHDGITRPSPPYGGIAVALAIAARPLPPPPQGPGPRRPAGMIFRSCGNWPAAAPPGKDCRPAARPAW
jgi:hypothetical protein